MHLEVFWNGFSSTYQMQKSFTKHKDSRMNQASYNELLCNQTVHTFGNRWSGAWKRFVSAKKRIGDYNSYILGST